MAASKYSAETREQAVRMVRDELASGAPSLTQAVKQVGQYLHIGPDTLRRWVREADAEPEEPAARRVAEPPPAAATAPPAPAIPAATTAPAAPAAPVYIAQTSRGVQAIVIAVALIASLVLGTFLVGTTIDSVNVAIDKADPTKQLDDYVSGKGTHEFYASDSRFRATFPFGMPKRETTKRDVGGTSLEFVSYTTENADHAFLVSTFEIAPSAPFDLNASVNGAAVGVGGTVTSSTLTKFQGFDAVEAKIAKGTELSISTLTVRAPTRVYVLQVVGKTDPATSYETFKQSFEIVTT